MNCTPLPALRHQARSSEEPGAAISYAEIREGLSGTWQSYLDGASSRP